MRAIAAALLITCACGHPKALSDAPAPPDARNADTAVAADAGLTPCTKPINKAMSFAGNQWVQMPDAPSLEPMDLTIEVWAKFTSFPGNFQTIVAKPLGTQTADSYALWYQAGKLNAGVNPTSPGDAIGYTFAPTIGQWYQLTFTYDHVALEQKLYVDGALVATGSTTSAPQYDTNPAIIGGDLDFGGPDGFFAGELDEVKIWTSVRDLSEVGLDVHSCTPGSFTGLAAYWALDEGTGQTTADASGHANTGTLGDGATADARDPSWIDSTVPF